MTVNIGFIVLMLFVGFSGHLNPASFPRLSVVGLAFPLTVIPVAICLVLWLLVKPRYALISIIGLLLAFVPMRNYCPINIQKHAPDSCLKVVSFNVMMFALADDYETPRNSLLQYLLNTDADIICLQEAETEPDISNMIIREMKAGGYYHSAVSIPGGNMLILFSRHRILSTERINFESNTNLGAASRILVNSDTVLVLNNHFESNKLSDDDKQGFNHIIKRDKDNQYLEKEARSLLEKIAFANAKRAKQVNEVARYIDTTSVKNIIVCGDFNDHPNSYTNRILAKRLTDCYRESGNGVGFTYKHGSIQVRIDHILCSKTFQPYEATVNDTTRLSDHLPISCKLFLKKK